MQEPDRMSQPSAAFRPIETSTHSADSAGVATSPCR